MSEVSAWVPWIAVALAAASLLYTIFNNRSEKNDSKFSEMRDRIETIEGKIDLKANRDTMTALHGKVDILEDRATRMESDMRHLPDHGTVSKLEGMIGSLSGQVAVLSERIRPIASIADRLQEKILESSGFDR